ncbi:acyltransferase [Candidatus Omnitrophota bacterium]
MKKNYFIHPTSLVDKTAVIGKDAKVWAFCQIMPGANIGSGCRLGQNVHIGPNVKIGNNVKIQNNVSVYEGVILEDGVFCGPSMVFTNVINPRSFISRMKELKPTLVKKGATLGASSTIICGHTIGRYAFIGAGSVVTKDIPDYALVYGNPGRIKGWMCECGVKIKFSSDNKSKCSACKRGYTKNKNSIKNKSI